MEPPVSVDHALAERFASLRLRYGLSLEDVAEGARSLGLEWSRGTVWAIEKNRSGSGGSGTRKLNVGEFFALPAILERSVKLKGGHKTFTLDDVMPRAGQIKIGRLRLPADALRSTLRSRSFDPDSFEDPDLEAVNRSDVQRDLQELADRVVPEVASEVLRWTRSPLDRYVARKLGLPVGVVSIAAYLRWGESLTDHRTRAIPPRDRADLNKEAVRRQEIADRGHATREMLGDERFIATARGLATSSLGMHR